MGRTLADGWRERTVSESEIRSGIRVPAGDSRGTYLSFLLQLDDDMPLPREAACAGPVIGMLCGSP